MAIRVVILGGGFAGIEAVRSLSAYRYRYGLDVKLVNQHRWGLFSPLMPDLISGRVYPEHMAYDLEPFCRRHGAQFIHSRALSVDIVKKTIQLPNASMEADYLLLCLGCETNYHGNDEFKRRIPGLKSLHEGILIRHLAKRIIDEAGKSPGIKPNILVVGAGYTGFEVASHIALYASQYCGHPLERLSEAVNILLIEYGNRVLANTTEGVQQWAKKFIGHYGISIKTGATLKELRVDRTAVLTDGSEFADSLPIWTAGVAPGPVIQSLETPRERTGRLEVDSYLRLPGHPDIFAAGDVAAPVLKGQQQPLRMSVQFSRAGGQVAARNILRAIRGQPLAEFDPFDPGYVIPLGPGHAMSVILGHEMHGRTPFLLHYMMSIWRSWGWKNKFAIMKDLSSELLPWPQVAKRHDHIDRIHKQYWQTNPPADNHGV